MKEKGVALRVLDQNIDTITSEGKLMFHMLGAFAEFENDIRREHQQNDLTNVLHRPVEIAGEKRNFKTESGQ